MTTRLVALVLCLVAGLGGAAAEAAAPQPTDPAVAHVDLPVGAPTTLPWWQRGRLHVGDAVIRTDRDDIASRGGTTLIAADEYRRGGLETRWFLVDGRRLSPLPTRTPVREPLISASGRWLAWKETRAPRTDADERVERLRVVLYDVRHRVVVNTFRERRLVDQGDAVNGIWLNTLSNQGRLLFLRGVDGDHVLSPRGRSVRFVGPEIGYGGVPSAWPRGTTAYRSRTERSVYGAVARDGSFTRAGSFGGSSAGSWAPDGGRYVYSDDDPDDVDQARHWVRDLDGTRRRLGVPQDGSPFHVVGWESPSSVVLWSYDDYSGPTVSRLVRCSTATGACEQVPDGPRDGPRATMR